MKASFRYVTSIKGPAPDIKKLDFRTRASGQLRTGDFFNAGRGTLDEQALKPSCPLHHALDLLTEAVWVDSSGVRELCGFIAGGLRSWDERQVGRAHLRF